MQSGYEVLESVAAGLASWLDTIPEDEGWEAAEASISDETLEDLKTCLLMATDSSSTGRSRAAAQILKVSHGLYESMDPSSRDLVVAAVYGALRSLGPRHVVLLKSDRMVKHTLTREPSWIVKSETAVIVDWDAPIPIATPKDSIGRSMGDTFSMIWDDFVDLDQLKEKGFLGDPRTAGIMLAGFGQARKALLALLITIGAVGIGDAVAQGPDQALLKVAELSEVGAFVLAVGTAANESDKALESDNVLRRKELSRWTDGDRKNAVARVRRGESLEKVAARYDVQPRTVHRWMQRF